MSSNLNFENLFINSFSDSVLEHPFLFKDKIFKKSLIGEIRSPEKQIAPPIVTVCNFIFSDEEPLGIYSSFGEQDWIITEAFEGTLIRVYYYNDQWRISTIRKLDAYKSFWGSSKSFGSIFEDYLLSIYKAEVNDLFWNQLDKNHVYHFFLRTTSENKVAIKNPPTNKSECLVFLGKYIRSYKEYHDYDKFLFAEELNELPDLLRQRHLNKEELTENKVNSYDVGLFLIHKPSQRYIKIYSQNYYDNMSLRNNCSNIELRYIELIVHSRNKVVAYENLFHDHISTFRALKYAFDKFACDLLTLYLDKYVKKQTINEVDGAIHTVLKSVHTWHKSDRQNNKANLQIVAEKILEIIKWTKLRDFLQSIIENKTDKINK